MTEKSPHLESERRIATVMFADISGFTAMSEKMDPEQVTGVMNKCFRMMGECIEQYGGTIDKFIGDCVMVLFGVPKALEDAPQKAVNTAIELKNRLYRFNREKNLSIPLDIHVGINTGLVVAGMVGSEKRQDFTVMGDTVNLASRLEGAALIGQILVGPDTYKATKHGFRYKPLQPITLKGKAEPVPVYELLSERETLHRVQPGTDRTIASVMVGRDSELATLESLVMKAVAGSGAIVNVIGEAGIGKSRLIAELKNSTVMQSIRILEGRAISIGANLGYHLIIDLLKNWARIAEDDSEIAAFTMLESAIRTAYPEAVDEILPFVATLMGIKLEGHYAERVKGVAGEALEKLILKNVRDLVTQGSRRTPLVVILEDLHWADTSSIELVESLLRLAAKERIVFINVFRPGYSETGDRITKTIHENYLENFSEITVRPLDEKQTEALIANLLNIKGFPHNLREQIKERAGGNPYFIEEVVRSFIDEGAVVLKDDGFEITEKLGSLIVPHTINEVLMARIDRLEHKTRDLVRVASVIGRNFFYKILAEVAGTVEDIDSRLEYLKDIQLIRERQRMEELEYLFKHALAQEVAYDSILVQRRKELHRSVADSIEKVFSKRLHEFYGMLAYHYTQAEDIEKSEEYLIKAGEEALKSSASSEALHYYRQALDQYLKKYGEKADPEKVAMLEKNIALALFNKGKYAESVPYFEKVLAFHGERSPKNPILKVLKFISGFIATLVSIYLPILKWKKDPSPRDKEIISLLAKKCVALIVTDPQEFFIQTIYALNRQTKYDVTKLENGKQITTAISTLFSYPGLSFSLSRKALQFSKDKLDTNDFKSVLYYKCCQLIHACLSGEWPKEIEFDEELMDRNLSIGEFMYPTSSICFSFLMYSARGEFNAARTIIQKATDIGEAYDNEYSKVIKLFCNSYFLMRRRKFQDALNEVEAGIQFIGKTGFGIYLIMLHAMKAHMQLLLGDMNGAIASIKKSEQIKSENMPVPPIFLGDLVLSRFLLNLHWLDVTLHKGNKKALRQQRKHTFRSGKEALKLAGKFAPIKTEALKLMGAYYWVIGKQRKAMRWWRKAIAEGQQLDDRLELSRTYFEVGKCLSEPKGKFKTLAGMKADAYLETAQSLFTEMDLQWDLAQIEQFNARGHIR